MGAVGGLSVEEGGQPGAAGGGLNHGLTRVGVLVEVSKARPRSTPVQKSCDVVPDKPLPDGGVRPVGRQLIPRPGEPTSASHVGDTSVLRIDVTDVGLDDPLDVGSGATGKHQTVFYTLADIGGGFRQAIAVNDHLPEHEGLLDFLIERSLDAWTRSQS